MGTIQEKLKEKLQDIHTNIQYNILKKDIKPETKPADTSFKKRLIPAAIGGLSTLAGTTIIPKFLLKTHLPKSIVIGSTLAGSSAGYFMPDIYNAVLESERNKISKEQAKNIIKGYDRIGSRLEERTMDVAKAYQEELSKRAGIIGGTFKMVRPLISGTAKAVGTGIRLIGQGLRHVPKTAPLSSKAFGIATKAGVGAALYAGGSKSYKALSAPRSSSNYTTFLRNNILAGNIRPGELSPMDIENVRKLGMR